GRSLRRPLLRDAPNDRRPNSVRLLLPRCRRSGVDRRRPPGNRGGNPVRVPRRPTSTAARRPGRRRSADLVVDPHLPGGFRLPDRDRGGLPARAARGDGLLPPAAADPAPDPPPIPRPP